MTLSADRIINGSYGRLFVTPTGDTKGANEWTYKAEYLGQVRSVSARIAVNRQEVVPVGDSWTRYKKTNYTGDGSFVLYKATSKFLNMMIDAVNDKRVPTLTMLVELEDPESLGHEEIQLLNVKIWEVPIGFESGELVEETIQFTFEGILQPRDMVIGGDITS